MNERSGTRRHYLTAIGAVGATALAGCQDQTDADRSGNGDGTNDPEANGNSAGLSDDGIEDASALVSATRSALTTQGYELAEELSSTGIETTDRSQRTRSSLTDERQVYVLETASTTSRAYVDGGTYYEQTMEGGETESSTRELNESFERIHTPDHLSRGRSLGGVLEAGTYVSAGTTTRNGRELRQFDLESVSLQESGAASSTASGTVLATDDGVVFEATLSFEGSVDGTAITREQSGTVTELGEIAVERPSWVDAASQ
ncbi:hypothetical protein [Natrinema sp. 1APR25-10V2]|uniref:hypothetical protein n=1 Tax=Natrinema sp. 1APR25-10V2 TaxID=2951081 RepID=UPI0028763065|nr:hypothetical protein [Natrinema sp. 1APR25-10V2]MDS0475311.1 hypothetical protein [Natrinema sp. 1APR25-10V2]